MVAEEPFAAGCELLVSAASAGQIAERLTGPVSFILIASALREEGTVAITWRRATGAKRPARSPIFCYAQAKCRDRPKRLQACCFWLY
jgi:hypothetical protein